MNKVKKIIFRTIIVILVSVYLYPVSAAEQRVYDYAGLFSESETASLESSVREFAAAHNMDFVILTSDDVGGKSSIAYADDFYDSNLFGTGSDYSGILYFIDMDNRVPTISTCGVMIDYITDARLDNLLDTAYYKLADGKYAASAEAVLEETEKYVIQGIPAGQYRYEDNSEKRKGPPSPESFVFAFIAAVIAGLITSAIIKSGYSVKGTKHHYRPGNTVNMTLENDIFLRESVSRARISQNGGSGGGSGSRVHTSSSGRSHGGGSGRSF